MRYTVYLLVISLFCDTFDLTHSTCVVESDFGFNLNCALKKSGLFRVRNLGGVKAHIGVGFSVGDELGFRESLSNLESNRRRSSPGSKVQAQLVELHRQGKLNNSFMVRSIPAPLPLKPPPIAVVAPQRVVLPQLHEALRKSDLFFATIPPFKPIPPAAERPTIINPQIPSKSAVATPALMGIAVPAFSAIPNSISRLSNGPTYSSDKKKPEVMAVMVPITKNQHQDKLSNTDFSIRRLNAPDNEDNEVEQPAPQSPNTIQALLAANNITEDILEAALLQRQQQLAKQRVRTTTTTVAPRPTFTRPRGPSSSIGKVMNAPREYYPVGYDKNFDDNFASKVELPETSFSCGEQKHFPGLYADEDLGCMVFHVCALTDDGLITKSFLCPESTLFDQAILKCNWWFYVDCKNSKKLYDSNIPVSKSYQLMKALTFFSAYKKDKSTTTMKPNSDNKEHSDHKDQ